MTEWKTLRVPTDAWEKAKHQKESEDRTWGDQIVRPPEDDEAEELDPAELADAIADDLRDGLARDVADEIERRLR